MTGIRDARADGFRSKTRGGSGTGSSDGGDDGHRIFVDPWADDDEAWHDTGHRAPPGPSELP